MTAAKAYAQLSHAKRLQVGAVLVRDDRVISIGYNGTTSGSSNVCEVELHSVINGKPVVTGLRTKQEVVHAETNVIAFAARNGVSTNQCIMVITHAPCFECSKLIVQAGITKVYYEEEYRIMDGVKFLRDCNVTVEKFIYEPTRKSLKDSSSKL